MENDLVERYIYAVRRKLPQEVRDDVEKEIRTLIEDMLEARCGQVKPEDRDVRVVLAELGAPAQLAQKYSPHKHSYLIGPEYYGTYLLLLKIVLPATGFGILLAGVVSSVIDQTVSIVTMLQWFGTLLMGLIQAFAFVTLLFAFFDRQNVRLHTNPGLDDLPPVPKKKETISRWEPIVGIIFSIVFCMVFIFAPQIFFVAIAGGKTIPLFDRQAVQSLWYLFAAFAALSIIRDSVKLYEGRYTTKTAVTAVVTDLLSIPLAVTFLGSKNIINPTFQTEIANIFPENGEFFSPFFANAQYFFMGIILFALLLDMATNIYHAIRKK